ncbi:Mur ligase family protein, partial [Deinococcus pimensis]|uniref:Mur ligase family protein n=1 Tax=Deinococcus pimensis TaxID=309888 RepID=UPI0005EADE7C
VGKTTAKTYVGAALGGRFMPVFNTLNAIACFLLTEAEGDAPLVVEMGIDRIGEMRELMDLVAPDVGVVTAIGEAHLEAFGTKDTIAREKGVILEAPYGVVSTQAAPWYPDRDTYGFEEDATYGGRHLDLSPAGASFTFHGRQVTLPLVGRAAAEAAVLGLALASRLGVDLAEAA